MAEATSDQLIRLHSAGVALSRAWQTYAHPDLKTKWQDLQKPSVVEALSEDAKTAASINGDMVAKLTKGFARSQTLFKERGNLERTLKSNILDYIANGRLHGFGYELPRSLTSAPVAIPKEAWSGQCDWPHGTLRFNGLELADVRLTTFGTRFWNVARWICHPHALSVALPSQKISKPPSARLSKVAILTRLDLRNHIFQKSCIGWN